MNTFKPLALTLMLTAAASAHAQPPAVAPAGAPAAVNVKTADAPVSNPGGKVTLDFANAEIDAVARAMATITGRNVVVDPRVKGTMSLTSTVPVPPREALRLFSTQLRTQGFALVDSNGMYLVLPEADAKLQSGPVAAGSQPAAGGQIMTQVFRLTHENANNLVPILRPLISPNNTINADASTNSLVITDYADNLQRLGRIVTALDVANATGVEVVRLRYAVASDLAPLVTRLLEPGGGGAAPVQPVAAPGAAGAALSVGSGDGYRTTLAPEPRSNSIIVRAANPARLALAINLIQQLDQPPSSRPDETSGNIHVVYLKNSDATKLAVTLRAALAALPGQTSTPGGGGVAGGGANTAGGLSMTGQTSASTSSASSSSGLGGGPTINATANNQPSTGGQIQADPATNSLIISAPDPIYRELRAVIDQLDQRRAQVFVESLIVEVNIKRAADLGIQWQSLMSIGGNATGLIGTSSATGSPNIFNFAGQFVGTDKDGNPTFGAVPEKPVYPNAGFNFIAGSRKLGVLANFLQNSGIGNVLSTPTLLTLDNEEARIMVGQNVPFVSGQYTMATSATNAGVNPFQTTDWKDVGITLRVRPQIGEDGTIKLVIFQEASSIVAGTGANTYGPTTSKRAIESSVLVSDGAIVVLGGLLEDTYESAEDKVPVLGDVPLLGNLFKSRSRSYSKTNLMVFLRPVIVRDAAAAESYSLSRYDYMRVLQQGAQIQPGGALDVGGTPMLPQQTPVRPDTPARPAPPAPLITPPAARGAAAAQPPFVMPPAGDGNLYGF